MKFDFDGLLLHLPNQSNQKICWKKPFLNYSEPAILVIISSFRLLLKTVFVWISEGSQPKALVKED